MNLFTRWFAERPRFVKKLAMFFVPFGLLYMVYGFFVNIRKHKNHLASIDVVALILYVELFILGLLGKYPFTVPRTSLFFCPLVLVMIIKGIAQLAHLNSYLYRTVQALYIVFLLYVAVGITRVIFTQDFAAIPQIW